MACMREVRASAEVDKVTNSIGACQSIIRYFSLDEVSLESVVAKQIESFLLRKFQSLEAMLGLNYLLNQSFQSLEVSRTRNNLATW